MPAELLATGRNEVKGYGGEFLDAEVSGLAQGGSSSFSVLLTDGRSISGRRLLITTGLTDELPHIPGLQDRWARDVLHCPYCHGYEVRDQPLGILGGSPDTVRYAQIIRQWSDDVVLFAPTDTLSDEHRSELLARSIRVVEGTPGRILVENDHLTGIRMEDGRVIPRKALFVPPRFVPNNHLLVSLGCEVDQNGWPVKDSQGQTTVPGAWVAGNVANPRAQVITAAGEGSAAAIAINADLVDEDIRNAVGASNFPSDPLAQPTQQNQGAPMTSPTTATPSTKVPPPNKHQLALMIWLAVFPTLAVINVVLGEWLGTLAPVLRTFVLATIAVPIVIYGLMPQLHRLRTRLIIRRSSS